MKKGGKGPLRFAPAAANLFVGNYIINGEKGLKNAS